MILNQLSVPRSVINPYISMVNVSSGTSLYIAATSGEILPVFVYIRKLKANRWFPANPIPFALMADYAGIVIQTELNNTSLFKSLLSTY